MEVVTAGDVEPKLVAGLEGELFGGDLVFGIFAVDCVDVLPSVDGVTAEDGELELD